MNSSLFKEKLLEIQEKELLNAHLDALYTKHGVYFEK